MGWSNYIIIADWKLVIETNRDVNELEDYRSSALDRIIDDENIDDTDMINVKLNELTVGNLAILLNSYTNMSDLVGIEPDKLFLYWLESRSIEYDIKSEHNINTDEFKEKGYIIIRRDL